MNYATERRLKVKLKMYRTLFMTTF